MSSWRRMALELLPEQKFQNSRDYFSVYMIFFDLLPLAVSAHQSLNEDLLQRIYKYAEWCWTQKDKSSDTYNAVCVAFYEHLVDEEITSEAIPKWIKPVIFEDIRDVFEPRMTTDEYQALLLRYNLANQTHFQ
jgi:hypothetical protein